MDRIASDGPLITVYITSYNYGRFIKRAIDSVLEQTCRDFELLIIDDGSVDDSRDTIARYAGHPQVTPILQKNRGLNITNNIALRAARGRYVMRLDADDWLDPHALEILSGIMTREPEVGMVFPDYYLVDYDGNILEQIRRHDFSKVTMLDQPAHGACTMIRHDCLMELGGYNERFRCQDGYELWLRFIQRFNVRNVNLPLFYYRQHGGNLTSREERILETRSRIIRDAAAKKKRPLKVVAVVPVRGLAVNPASIAMRELGGKPLVEWTLDAALHAAKIEEVIFTSPDQDLIRHVANVYGQSVTTVLRDPHLAMPNTFLVHTLRHALESSGRDASSMDAVMCLNIESPFRRASHIDTAVDVMEIFESKAIVGVRPDPSVFYVHNGCGLAPLREDKGLRLEREEIFREAGRMRLLGTPLIFENLAIPKENIGHVVLDEYAAMSIRTDHDWHIANLLVPSFLKHAVTK